MKKSLFLLAISLTLSLANDNSSKNITASQSIDRLTKGTTIIREVPTLRNVRKSRETRKPRIITISETREVPSFRLARGSRKIRENRLIVQTTRASRKICHLAVQNTLHLAHLK